MKKLTILVIFAFIFQSLTAQQNNDTLAKKSSEKETVPIVIADHHKKTKLLPAMIVPASLVLYGLTTLKNNGLYSSVQAQKDVQATFGRDKSHIDDILIYAPYMEFGVLLVARVKCTNDVLNTALLIAKSEMIMQSLTWGLKYITHEERPDHSDYQSMPSGHTAEAFCAATIVYREYRYKSVWFGIGAYALATTVAAFRMINNKHWESDVIIGAGVGIFSTNIVYATHLHKWGRKDVCLAPAYDGKTTGFAMSIKF